MIVLLLIGGCGGSDDFGGLLEAPTVEVLAPDANRDGLGQDGVFGALKWSTSLRVRVDQTLPVDVYLPTDSGGLAEGPFAPVLVVQGALVATDRYGWLGRHVASRGFVVLIVSHTGNLAPLEGGNALEALFAAQRASATGAGPLASRLDERPGMIVGHSLGGAIASDSWLSAPDALSHLVLLAARPADGDDLERRTSGRVLAMVGTADGAISSEDLAAAATRFRVPIAAAAINGMNHYQFTDDVTEFERGTDGEATIPDTLARSRALYLFDAALEELDGSETSVLDNPTRWPTGIDPLGPSAEPVVAEETMP